MSDAGGLLEDLWAAPAPPGWPMHAASPPDGLPPVAARVLARTIPAGTRVPHVLRLAMRGHIRLGPAWLPFTADQVLAPVAGFVWRARVAGGLMAGADSFVVGGEGRMDFRLAGGAPLVQGAGPDVTRSALGRLVLEGAGLLPVLLLPDAGARWAPGEDPARGQVVIPLAGEDHRVAVVAGPDGAIAEVAMMRHGPLPGGGHGPRPFGAVTEGHRETGGVLVPTRLRAGWRGAEFFRAEITGAEVR
ncbi:MAG: hypothetical protein MUE51_01990 [Thermoleophilia bacterium]|nr:hypothetical protein [Thermoleophilia bacterium]